MRGKTLIIGSRSRVGRMLSAQWRQRDAITWISRKDWRVEDGADALAPFTRDVAAILCLAGTTQGNGGDLALNTAIAQSLCSASSGAHVFYASTQAVYGRFEGTAQEDSEPVDPNAYGVSKRAAEQVALSSGASVTVLRLGNVVGADLLSRNIREGKKIPLDTFPDGTSPVRSYIDPVRLALCLDRLVALAQQGHHLPDVLNVASDPALDMSDILSAAEYPFVAHPAPETALRRMTMDCTRLFTLVPDLAARVSASDALAARRKVEALM